MAISLKVNVIVQAEFELANFKAIVQHFSHYALWIPLQTLMKTTVLIKFFFNFYLRARICQTRGTFGEYIEQDPKFWSNVD